MDFTLRLLDTAPLLAWVFLFAAQLLLLEVGYLVGRRYPPSDAGERDGIGVIVTTLLALASFIMAMSLNIATGRFEEERGVIVAEANAIETAWLRASALPEEQAARIALRLQDYAAVRAAFVAAPPDPVVLERLDRQSAALQGELWREMTALLAVRVDPAVVNLQASLNDTFDAATLTRYAFTTPLGRHLFLLLATVTTVAVMALGLHLGLRLKRQRGAVRVGIAVLCAVWTLLLLNILDLATGRIGYVRPSAQPYEWFLDRFRSGPQP